MDSMRNLWLMTGHVIIDGFISEFASDRWPYYRRLDALRNLCLRTGHIIIDGSIAEFFSEAWPYYH